MQQSEFRKSYGLVRVHIICIVFSVHSYSPQKLLDEALEILGKNMAKQAQISQSLVRYIGKRLLGMGLSKPGFEGLPTP